MEFDANGNFIKAFGAGKLLFPHGLYIDKDDHIWLTDGHVGDGIGDDVLEFDRDGKVLRTLGTPGVKGDGQIHVRRAQCGDRFAARRHLRQPTVTRRMWAIPASCISTRTANS